MKLKLVSFLKIFVLSLIFAATCHAAPGSPVSLNSSNTSITWKLRSQADVNGNTAIHNVGFSTTGWVTGIVPGTVFGSYVAAGQESDPNFGSNIYDVDSLKYDRNFYYRTEFTIPSSYSTGKIWLNLEGINRDADIYVNGNNLGKISGIVQRGKLDITNIVFRTGNNTLVILVYLPIAPLNDCASPTYISSASWDWMPYVPGLNMGITDDIYLSNDGNVGIIDPWMRTDLPTNATANLSLKTDLKNSTGSAQTGVLTAVINPGNVTVTQTISLAANETKTISWDKNAFSQLAISNPNLWWPNGYGAQNMYSCALTYSIGGVTSDTKTFNFGIKKYTYDTTGDVLHIWVNGKRIFVKGGNWGMSEYMLRCRGAEYDTKLRFHKEMNFNMIRNWLGSTTDDEFYTACDKYGMMVWDDFWLAATYIYFPRDKTIFQNNVIEKVKRNRNHPCIAVWCGANESTPPADYDAIYSSAVSTYDGNDRRYQPNSNSGGLSSSGPWVNFAIPSYFSSAPRVWGGPDSYGMRTEIGTPVFTTAESFRKFIPTANLWPRNEMWNKHFFGNSATNAGPDTYFNSLNTSYGTSSNIDDFCKKAQFLNIETNKAIFECWQDRMWNDASGVLVWMSQSAYPSLVWQTYDYYYDLNGAYWGVKKACERFHVQWNSSNNSIKAINASDADLYGMIVTAKVYNKDGSEVTALAKTSASFNLGQNSTNNCFTLFDQSATLSDVHFIKLEMKDGAGNVWSDNFYWRGTTSLNYTGLNTMPAQNLIMYTSTPVVTNGICTFKATVTNPSTASGVAFGIKLQVVKSGQTASILPVIMNDNYFSLLKGESKTVTFEFDNSLLGGAQPAVLLSQYANSGTQGPANLASNKPVTASSTDGNQASGAVDCYTNTRWSSAYSDPQWIYVDLGAIYNVNRVKLTWEGAYGKDYLIQVSNDAVNWTTVKTIAGNTSLTNDHTGLSGTGRYVRMYGTARGTGWGYSIYELEVYGTLANLALNKAVTVSSTYGTNTGAFAVDANSSTRWESNYSDPQWIYVDLGTTYDINRVKLTWEGAYGKDYLVQTSTDATNWTTIKTVTGNTVLVNDHTGLTGNGRYVRIYGTARGTMWGYSIYELEVYGILKIANAKMPAIHNNVDENPELTTEETNAVFLYPNPVTNTLNVANLKADTKLMVFDMMGAKIASCTGTSINVSDIKSGVYMLKVLIDDKYKNMKFVKQ